MEALARQRSATVAAWQADVATRPEGAWARLGDVCVHTTGIRVPHWNGAHVVGPATPWYDVSDWFRAREMPYGVLIPAELDITPPGPIVVEQRVMLRDLTGLPPAPEVELRWDAGADAAAVQAEAFEDPLAPVFVAPKLVNAACALVVAYDEGHAAATATLVVVDGVAAVYGVGTTFRARRRGLGRAVTLAALHEGLARDCDLAYLNPSDLGYGVYAALGFKDAPPWRVHAPA